jgi:hypothetical protein
MTDLIKKRTIQQARAREKRILEGVAEIGPFLEDKDWKVLGFESFGAWADARLFPVLNSLNAVIKRELQPSVHKALNDEGMSLRRIAARTGASKDTVSRDLEKLKVEPTVSDETVNDLDTTSDQDIVDAELVEDPDLGNNLYEKVQEYKKRNPTEPAQDTPEMAARWIPALIEAINSDLDNIADWQEISDDQTRKQLREELDILRDKIARIEEKL